MQAKLRLEVNLNIYDKLRESEGALLESWMIVMIAVLGLVGLYIIRVMSDVSAASWMGSEGLVCLFSSSFLNPVVARKWCSLVQMALCCVLCYAVRL